MFKGTRKLIVVFKTCAVMPYPDPVQYGYFYGATAPSGPRTAYYRGFTIALGHITLCRTSLDE